MKFLRVLCEKYVCTIDTSHESFSSSLLRLDIKSDFGAIFLLENQHKDILIFYKDK